MKVYEAIPKTRYSGGVILIAANNKKEAKELMPPYFEEFNEPKEIKYLTANVEEPVVLLDYTYFE